MDGVPAGIPQRGHAPTGGIDIGPLHDVGADHVAAHDKPPPNVCRHHSGRPRRAFDAFGYGTIAKVTSTLGETQRLRDLKLLRSVRDRMDREYAQPLDVEALARGVNMSAGHLSRQFKLAYGESPYSYLMTRRIERAMALLRRGDLSVTEVCFAVGCSSLGTFSTRFTELVGVPPSSYREQAALGVAEMPSCVVKQVTRPIRGSSNKDESIRNEEARVPGVPLA